MASTSHNIMTDLFIPSDLVELIIEFIQPPVVYSTTHWMVRKLYTRAEWLNVPREKQDTIVAEYKEDWAVILGY